MTSRLEFRPIFGLLVCALFFPAISPASAADALNPMVRISLTRPGAVRALLVSCDRAFLIENERGVTIVQAPADAVYSVAVTSPSSLAITNGVSSSDPEASESGAQTPAFGATASQLTVYGSGGILRIAGNPTRPLWHGYHGDLHISQFDSQLSLCNVLPLETYLLGVLGPEIGASAPLEAMKAQAVATRTYTLKNLGKLASIGADLDDTTRTQSYTGTDAETSLVRDAVQQTQGKVLTYQGQLIDAVYATDCGGRTALGPPSEPYLQPVDDPDCMEKASWSYTVPLAQLSALVSTRMQGPTGSLARLAVDRADSSGRVASILLDGDHGATLTVTGAQMRQLLGYDALRSTWFTVTLTHDKQCLFTGRGWGHGLGMCQRGAIAMAQGPNPASYWEILTHYYTGVQIVSLTPDLLQSSQARH